MKLKEIKISDCKTTSWNGGKTTELFIYPPESSYEKRDFQARLSMATVTDEYSIFTLLPGISRNLLVLEGEINLKIGIEEMTSLKEYDSIVFDGGKSTECFGTCKDFNLMLQNCKGGVEVFKFNQEISLTLKKDVIHIFYFVKGNYHIAENENLYSQDSLLIVQSDEKKELHFLCKNEGILIKTTITI